MSPAVLAGGFAMDGAIAQTPNPAPDSHQNRPTGQTLPAIAPTPTRMPQPALPERFDHPGENAPAIATSRVPPSAAVQVASTESWAIAPQPTPPEIFDHPETRFSASSAQIPEEEEETELSSEPLSSQERGRGEVSSASSAQYLEEEGTKLSSEPLSSQERGRGEVSKDSATISGFYSPIQVPLQVPRNGIHAPSAPEPFYLPHVTPPRLTTTQDLGCFPISESGVEVEKFDFENYHGEKNSDKSEFKLFTREELKQIKLSCPPFEGMTIAEVSYPQKLSLPQLLKIADDVAKFYGDRGYKTSGAIIKTPPNNKGTVTIRVIEGTLEDDAEVVGCKKDGDSPCRKQAAPTDYLRLREYVRSRLGVEKDKPLNVDRLQENLQLLSLDPLLRRIQAELIAGAEVGKSRLLVAIEEAPSFGASIELNNRRSPSVGTFSRQVEMKQASLLIPGDGLAITYGNTDGSNSVSLGYTLPLRLPLSRHYGTLQFRYSRSASGVVEQPFRDIDQDGFGPDIKSKSSSYEIELRQPIWRSIQKADKNAKNAPGDTVQEFTLGLTASLQDRRSTLLGIPFPLSAGADEQGRTRVAALRFSQDWLLQNNVQVMALRSQFNLGLGALGATINPPIPGVEAIPDSRFFSWQGQAQYVRRIGDSLWVTSANLQLADRTLLASEQFAIGGLGSVRGYRQDQVLTDNGFFATTELRVPIYRSNQGRNRLQVIPFADYGVGWNASTSANPSSRALASVGLGIQWSQGDALGDRFEVRLDWGIPLISVNARGGTWQESGVYFSVRYSF